MAERLLDRLEDCKRNFPVAAVLGGTGEAVLQRLAGGRAGVEKVLYMDASHDMLEKARQKQQVSKSTSVKHPLATKYVFCLPDVISFQWTWHQCVPGSAAVVC